MSLWHLEPSLRFYARSRAAGSILRAHIMSPTYRPLINTTCPIAGVVLRYELLGSSCGCYLIIGHLVLILAYLAYNVPHCRWERLIWASWELTWLPPHNQAPIRSPIFCSSLCESSTVSPSPHILYIGTVSTIVSVETSASFWLTSCSLLEWVELMDCEYVGGGERWFRVFRPSAKQCSFSSFVYLLVHKPSMLHLHISCIIRRWFIMRFSTTLFLKPLFGCFSFFLLFLDGFVHLLLLFQNRKSWYMVLDWFNNCGSLDQKGSNVAERLCGKSCDNNSWCRWNSATHWSCWFPNQRNKCWPIERKFIIVAWDSMASRTYQWMANLNPSHISRKSRMPMYKTKINQL